MATRRHSSANFYEEHKIYIVPALIGAVTAWFFSGSFMLAFWVAVAVIVGGWIGHKFLGN